jgi:hypothetical protein
MNAIDTSVRFVETESRPFGFHDLRDWVLPGSSQGYDAPGVKIEQSV